MIEQLLEEAIVSLVAPAAPAGTNVYAARRPGQRVLPAGLVEVTKLEGLSGSPTGPWLAHLTLSVHTHSGDDEQAAHAARFDALANALRAHNFLAAPLGGVTFRGRPFFGEVNHELVELHWVSTLQLRCGVRT